METKTIVGVPITIGGVGFTSDHAKNLKITVGPFDCEKSAQITNTQLPNYLNFDVEFGAGNLVFNPSFFKQLFTLKDPTMVAECPFDSYKSEANFRYYKKTEKTETCKCKSLE